MTIDVYLQRSEDGQSYSKITINNLTRDELSNILENIFVKHKDLIQTPAKIEEDNSIYSLSYFFVEPLQSIADESLKAFLNDIGAGENISCSPLLTQEDITFYNGEEDDECESLLTASPAPKISQRTLEEGLQKSKEDFIVGDVHGDRDLLSDITTIIQTKSPIHSTKNKIFSKEELTEELLEEEDEEETSENCQMCLLL